MPAPRLLLELPHLLALDKPAGWNVEPDKFGNPSVAQWVQDQLSKRYRNPYVGIVHRLDRRTSGVLVVAKKISALRKLNTQFAERKTRKVYHALVDTAPPRAEDRLRHFLGRDKTRKRATVFAKKQPETKEAILHYRTLEQRPNGYLLEIVPTHGRYHQIRAQLAELGCPIVGDALYGSSRKYRQDAIALHAAELHFHHPVSNNRLVVKAERPF